MQYTTSIMVKCLNDYVIYRITEKPGKYLFLCTVYNSIKQCIVCFTYPHNCNEIRIYVFYRH